MTTPQFAELIRTVAYIFAGIGFVSGFVFYQMGEMVAILVNRKKKEKLDNSAS
ncbi:MAG: hypothetical protein R3331_09215 [Sulfurospirillaceae bacterium]|nr:hypothetical protein [Sulfurospirillaceae bacterium]